MIHVKFKNLEKSQLAREIVKEKAQVLLDKYPDLSLSRIQVTLEMENSQLKAGPDLFKVKLQIMRGLYSGIFVEKKDSNLYQALSQLVEECHQVLNNFGDKIRVKQRTKERDFLKQIRFKTLNLPFVNNN